MKYRMKFMIAIFLLFSTTSHASDVGLSIVIDSPQSYRSNFSVVGVILKNKCQLDEIYINSIRIDSHLPMWAVIKTRVLPQTFLDRITKDAGSLTDRTFHYTSLINIVELQKGSRENVDIRTTEKYPDPCLEIILVNITCSAPNLCNNFESQIYIAK